MLKRWVAFALMMAMLSLAQGAAGAESLQGADILEALGSKLASARADLISMEASLYGNAVNEEEYAALRDSFIDMLERAQAQLAMLAVPESQEDQGYSAYIAYFFARLLGKTDMEAYEAAQNAAEARPADAARSAYLGALPSGANGEEENTLDKRTEDDAGQPSLPLEAVSALIQAIEDAGLALNGDVTEESDPDAYQAWQAVRKEAETVSGWIDRMLPEGETQPEAPETMGGFPQAAEGLDAQTLAGLYRSGLDAYRSALINDEGIAPLDAAYAKALRVIVDLGGGELEAYGDAFASNIAHAAQAYLAEREAFAGIEPKALPEGNNRLEYDGKAEVLVVRLEDGADVVIYIEEGRLDIRYGTISFVRVSELAKLAVLGASCDVYADKRAAAYAVNCVAGRFSSGGKAQIMVAGASKIDRFFLDNSTRLYLAPTAQTERVYLRHDGGRIYSQESAALPISNETP